MPAFRNLNYRVRARAHTHNLSLSSNLRAMTSKGERHIKHPVGSCPVKTPLKRLTRTKAAYLVPLNHSFPFFSFFKIFAHTFLES